MYVIVCMLSGFLCVCVAKFTSCFSEATILAAGSSFFLTWNMPIMSLWSCSHDYCWHSWKNAAQMPGNGRADYADVDCDEQHRLAHRQQPGRPGASLVASTSATPVS